MSSPEDGTEVIGNTTTVEVVGNSTNSTDQSLNTTFDTLFYVYIFLGKHEIFYKIK